MKDLQIIRNALGGFGRASKKVDLQAELDKHIT
jgi:hypothetical protein